MSNRKSKLNTKKGGSGYTELFKESLSPCYTDTTKQGWHAGGSKRKQKGGQKIVTCNNSSSTFHARNSPQKAALDSSGPIFYKHMQVPVDGNRLLTLGNNYASNPSECSAAGYGSFQTIPVATVVGGAAKKKVPKKKAPAKKTPAKKTPAKKAPAKKAPKKKVAKKTTPKKKVKKKTTPKKKVTKKTTPKKKNKRTKSSDMKLKQKLKSIFPFL